MKKDNGRVRNVLVSDLGLFKELLIRNLIRNNISYLQIENEFHFFDRIFRFYDFKMAEKLIDDGVNFFGQDGDSIRVLIENEMIHSKTLDDMKDMFLSDESEDVDSEKKYNVRDKSIPSFSKKKVQRDNYMLKQKIKNNKR